MPLVERDQCLKDLAHLLPKTPKAFHEAMRRMRNAPPEDLLDRTLRSGSNLTRDYAVAAIERLWSDEKDIRVYENGMLKLFVAKETYSIRVKKFDRQSRSRNVVTQEDHRYRFQKPIAGIPRLIHLELGYVANPLRTAIDDVRLVCLNGPGIYWSHSVINPASDDNVYDLFMGKPGPIHPRPSPRPRLVEPEVKIKPKKR